MQQHTKGVVGILLLLLEIYFSLQQWKNFATLSKIDKVIAKINRVSTFFGPPYSILHLDTSVHTLCNLAMKLHYTADS